MYSKIENPLTGRRVSINGKLGRSILRNYLNVLNGGAAAGGGSPDDEYLDLNWEDPVFYEDNIVEADGFLFPSSDVPSDTSSPLQEIDIDCDLNINQADRTPLGSGTFKTAYKPRCNRKFGKLSPKAPLAESPSSPSTCKKSALILGKGNLAVDGTPSDDHQKFINEIVTQRKFKGPPVYMQGKCIGLGDEFISYKLEKIYETDLYNYTNPRNFGIKRPIYIEDKSTNIKSSLKSFLLNIAINIHGKGGAHYDIKLENVLINTRRDIRTWLSESGKGKYITAMQITDFGLAGDALWGYEGKSKCTEKIIKNIIGSRGYKDPVAMDPRVISPDDHDIIRNSRLPHQRNKSIGLNYKSDIWALGKLILVLFFGELSLLMKGIVGPFEVKRESKRHDEHKTLLDCPRAEEETVAEWCGRIFSAPFYNKLLPESDLADLLFNMFQLNQNTRYNIIQVLEHPYFTDVAPNLADQDAEYSAAKSVILGYPREIERIVATGGDSGGGAAASKEFAAREDDEDDEAYVDLELFEKR